MSIDEALPQSSIRGVRFDGKNAAGTEVMIARSSEGWTFAKEDGVIERFALAQIVEADDTDDKQRTLLIPDGSLVALDKPLLRDSTALHLARVDRWIALRSNAWLSALGVLLVPAALLFLLIPFTVNLVAARIPVSFETKLGEVVLTSLMKSHFKRSEYPEAARIRLSERFEQLRAASGVESAKLVFFRGPPNAFALPGGIVAVSDELIALLGNDDRVVSVFAHELGHVQRRHGLRNVATHLLATQVLTVAMSHDQTTGKVVDLVARQLLNAKYSQDAEREADRYACELLAKVRQSPNALAESFEQFNKIGDRYNVNMDSGTYTSSHPPTGERIAASRACAKEFGFER
jgi:Zn-dependent protease with chaperone function